MMSVLNTGKKYDNKTALLFLAPSLIGFLIFFFIPFIGGLYYSFVDSPIGGSFVGLANYIELIKNPVFQKAGYNTLIFTVIAVPLNILFSLGLALLLNRKIYGRNIIRMGFIIPLVVPVASVVLVWQILFDMNGSLNAFIIWLGLSPIDWMKTDFARMIVVILYLWKNIGYNMVLFLAGLQNIPLEYYEAADIDGASNWRKFTSITLVYLTPTTFFVFVMSIINSFKVFREVYLISGAYPHDSIYMLQHYMNNKFASLDYQMLTSAAFIMAIFIYILVLLLFKIERKVSSTIGG
ncbi:binding-protein-dependent transport systems inner membrane component [Alkaliphilus metalliredigens QYMF]|uniref:Binding-protein-dependent transport systems inner membrane component n=1 Tax=Alkaliphilus metalliredigens (strain QYMF) TaxID=293826 RepID=A6TX91_ALKMQ|nr:sugar ABC transporter permease [Alkaliphilus metalliredigens]ABR50809.1 binding-protein-dependent transport systems inner membrane component [Alkaliphilus metalliredigens QYMF]